MSLWIRGYAIGIAGFLYGIVGYGLSIVTYILGATMGPLFFELVKLAALKPPIRSDTTIPARGLNPQRSRRAKGRSSRRSRILQADSLTATHGKSVPVDTQLRQTASLDSFRAESSLVLATPVITINHVDRIDNMSIKAPTITFYPGVESDFGGRKSSKRRSATISYQSLPLLPSSPAEDSPFGGASDAPNLEPLWDEKSRIPRSASSPQLATFLEKELSTPEPTQGEKFNFIGQSGKVSKRATRQEKSVDFPTYQSSPFRFFSAFPNVAKKRSQTLRTQPYDEPYCVPLPVCPIFPEHLLEKKFRRSRTLPPEEIGHPSRQPRGLARP